MLCLKVPKNEGEKVRQILLDENLLDKRFKIRGENDHIIMPLKEKPEDDMDYPVIERELEKREDQEGDYTNLIDIPDELRQELPSSYEIIGDIAVLKIPDELQTYKKQVGQAIIEAHKNVNTVLEDKGVTGEYRIREVELLAGEDKRKTIHREYGAEFEIDISKAYFSPRLATERWRVVQEVQPRETVFDMFAGVGPYSILIAKNVDVKQIHSVDINPTAYELLEKNIKRNKLERKITPYLGDAREFAGKVKADRIIMNLPHSAGEFIEHALKAIKDGIIHYYEILPYDEIEDRKRELIDEIEQIGFTAKIEGTKEVRTYSAEQAHMVFDIKVKKN